MLRQDPGRCPSCGERVTPYAAGCALCGAELDPRRWHAPPSRFERFLSRRRQAATGSLGRRLDRDRQH